MFVGTDVKSLAYFPIDRTWHEYKVNDVFQRLNTGGVPLSGADLLFSKIKESDPSFEENLVEISKWIFEVTNGYSFSANEILQLINLIVKGTTRVDASKVKPEEITKFNEAGKKIYYRNDFEGPTELFYNYTEDGKLLSVTNKNGGGRFWNIILMES